jgi:hypothetical protein
MSGEFSIAGVFFSGALLSGTLGAVLFLFARHWLVRTHFYEHVWHRHLVDIALYTIAWAAMAMALAVLFPMEANP